MKLILFDIDGTLVNTGGAGMRAMDRAFGKLCGIERALDGIAVAGRTDRVIVEDAAARLAPPLAVDEAWLEAFRDVYCDLLEEELANGRSASKRVLPGVEALLESLLPRRDVMLALLTGNFARSARIKLAHFALWDYFVCGAFGDAHVERNPLFDVAMAAARQHLALAGPIEAVYVIGDTPYDVACARWGGARAVAVATGIHPASDLHAAGADVVFTDLGDTQTVLERGLDLSP